MLRRAGEGQFVLVVRMPFAGAAQRRAARSNPVKRCRVLH
jgi:hypothetical protein